MAARESCRTSSKAIRTEQRPCALDERIDVLFLITRGRIGRQIRGELGGGARKALALRDQQALGDRIHVVAAIAVRRKRQLFGCQLEIAQPHAERENVHLPPGIVDVVLALDTAKPTASSSAASVAP